MKKIIIHGPSKLHGTVKVQGAKNANRNCLIPLLTNDTFVLENVPHTGTTEALLKIIELYGGKKAWLGKNTLHIDSTSIHDAKKIPADIFFYTSSGIVAIPILASRFGKCIIEKDTIRDDSGGDKIGGRQIESVIKTLQEVGYIYSETKSEYTF